MQTPSREQPEPSREPTLEDQLAAETEKYRALFESMDEGCVLQEAIYDENEQIVDIRYLEANPSALKIIGIKDIVGRRTKETFPTIEDYWLEACDRVVKTGIGERLEQPTTALQGTYDVRLSKVGGPESKQIVSIFTNVTERRLAEALLKRNADLNTFRVALSDALRPLANPLEIQAVANQLFGSHLNVSRAFYFEVTGESEKYLSVAGGGYINGVEIVPPGDYPADAYGAEVYNRLSAGETVVVSDVTAEPYLGEEQLAAYAHFEMAAYIAVPLRKDGKFVAGLSVNMNQPRVWTPEEVILAEEMAERTWATVERARAEAAISSDLKNMRLLRDLSARSVAEDDIQMLYGEIVEGAIAITNADGGTLRTLSDDSQELVLLAERGFAQHIATQLQRIKACSQSVCGKGIDECDRTFISFRKSDGTPLDDTAQLHIEAGFLYAQSIPLISRKGNLIGTVSTYWSALYQPTSRELRFLDLLARQAADLIEQKQADAVREQLLVREQNARQVAEQMNRVKDNFLAVLSHELRTPLNPILGWSRLLLSKPLDQAKRQKAYETIQRNAKLQTQLIDDLLDVAKILRGKLEIEDSPVSLVEVIKASIEIVKTSAAAKSISLHFTLADNRIDKSSERYLVRGNDARLQQVVWNLLSNAIKFTPNEGHIHLHLESVNGQAIVTVTDTGKGIQPEFLPYLFESFQQEDTSITRQYGGLGLGLSIVKYLVDAHGGTITADSPGEGKGATFTVNLPLLNPQTQAIQTEPQTEVAGLAGVKILAVDDNEDARELLQIFLEAHGANVKTVDSGTALLSCFDTFAPHILLCDIAMPDMDGYELLKQVQALPSQQNRSVPSIAITAHAHTEDRQRSLENGFAQHITKPIDSENLVNVIAELIHQNELAVESI
ncbi:MAG: ATP-binding protein [Cyanobacteria bacterium P01_D01_bin.1]